MSVNGDPIQKSLNKNYIKKVGVRFIKSDKDNKLGNGNEIE